MFCILDSTRCLNVESIKREEQKCNLTTLTSSTSPNELVFLERRKHLEHICFSRNKTSERTAQTIGTHDGKLTICLVQKSGCTSWSQLIIFINKDKEGVNSPLDISKFTVHHKTHWYKHMLHRNNNSHMRVIENSTRVLTVRNPYSRIWSAYVDKFVLPNYWGYMGKRLMKTIRKNASEKSLKYGHDVTFSEFVEYILPLKDPHWAPASTLCDPCLFHPFYVAKQETFSSDMKYILRQLVYNIFSGKTDLATFEILDQIEYVFHVSENFKHSLEGMQLIFSRLWRAFQYYGFIPDGLEFPQEKFTVCNKTAVTQLFIEEHNKWNVSKNVSKKQKHSLMTQAYRSIPLSILKTFQQKYKNDFELFQYESEPADIFTDLLNSTVL